MLSVAIICRDNAATIGRTLASVQGLATEVVAADSGSTDGTLDLLRQHAARVIRTPWLGFVATKQLALDACTMPWILALDSDESVEPALRGAIEAAVSRDDKAVSGYTINRKVYYRDRPLNFAWQPEHRLRLVRRGHARWGGLDPHDQLRLTQGRSGGLLPGTLRHDSVPTWSAFLEKQASHAAVMAASMHRDGQRGSLFRAVTSPPSAFLKQLVIKQAWRDGWAGWLAAGSTAAGAFMKHAALLELSRSSRPPDSADSA
ncbi:MAG: glycosyltransferase family 2 protein [Phycisphaerales bacterium]|nr:glycosyltransferase family 2 protein [Phycisphaerales bacterium]